MRQRFARSAWLLLGVCAAALIGVPSAAAQLFRPFSKSAHQAAVTAPGVGLGLALSRRLARQLGGDLLLAESPCGAAFELRLVRSESGVRT